MMIRGCRRRVSFSFCFFCSPSTSFSTIFSKKLPHGFWRSQANLDCFTRFLVAKRGDDWNSLTSRDLKKYGGGGLITHMGSFSNVKDLYLNSSVTQAPAQIPSRSEQKRFLLSLKDKLSITYDEDWFLVRRSHLKCASKENGEYSSPFLLYLLTHYPSTFHMISELLYIYPKPSYKGNIPTSYWNKVEHQRIYMDKVLSSLDIEITNEVQRESLTSRKIEENGGKRILRLYSSMNSAFQSIYPEYDWNFYKKGNRFPHGFWKAQKNHKKFLESFAKFHSIGGSPADWEKVTYGQIIDYGGKSLFTYYTSVIEALRANYPEREWKAQHFRKPLRFWHKEDNILEFLSYVEQELNIRDQEDWYRVSRKQITELGGFSLLQRHGSLANLLQAYKPSSPSWNLLRFQNKDKRSEQRMLFMLLSSDFFPNFEVIEDYFHHELTRQSGAPVQFDVFIPAINVAFEYHGKHHFEEIPSFGSLELYQQRDQEKIELCKSFRIQLVTVPYDTVDMKRFIQNQINALQIES